MSLGIESQYQLRDFFKEMADLELTTERQREILAKNPDFEPYAAYQRVNRKGDGRLSPLEIYSFLK
jgi:CRISPR/Cas system CSM-associated protein Csm2 small subunit